MINIRIREHFNESLNYFPKNRIIGCWLQGSQNYNLANENSDIDTKLIVTPSLKDLALNRNPISTTHVRANNEHTDWKDVRLYIETFRKQNLNFLEILFTKYYIWNLLYSSQWERLIIHREAIARMNPYRAVKSMKGIALNKYAGMEHLSPAKAENIKKYGYDPKEVSHLIRVRDYLERYIKGEKYEDCLIPSEKYYDLIYNMKLGQFSLEEARKIAEENIKAVTNLADNFCSSTAETEDHEMRELLEDVCYEIVKISIQNEVLE